MTDRDLPLGLEQAGPRLAGLGSLRLADHLATARAVGDARRALGRGRGEEHRLAPARGAGGRGLEVGRGAGDRDADLGLGR